MLVFLAGAAGLPRVFAQRPLREADRPSGAAAVADPRQPYGHGTHAVAVDVAKSAGTIRSLLGVNRGPFSWPPPPRPGGGPARAHGLVSHVEDFRALGVDMIRSHDFYGPTDWYVMFPDWSRDPDDPAAYDFRTSDERIRAIVTNGFGCFFRLGTSWKGGNPRPINDPPGTIRDASGRVTHEAGPEDFRKWGSICAHVVRHYTGDWNGGLRAPIRYWEIWNEPDLAAQFWTGTPDQFHRLYEAAARAIKEVDPALKVGGPGCTGAMRTPYVEGFLARCRERSVPLDFFSWHSYGGRDRFNPHDFVAQAARVRAALDTNGFARAENIVTEWNAGIQHRLFSDTPAGAAYYASSLAAMLDAGVARAFQYCGDLHPGLGLFDPETRRPKICASAFAAWTRLMETPLRVGATGGDEQGYAVVAGRDAAGTRVQVLVSDFQSGYDTLALKVTNLPWGDGDAFTCRHLLVDADHRLEPVGGRDGQGRILVWDCASRSGSVNLFELSREVANRGP